MRKSIHTLFVLAAVLLGAACSDYETYGELKEKERDNISKFISDSSFVIIGEEQFQNQGNRTEGSKQFVYLTKSGIYMQILRQGCGENRHLPLHREEHPGHDRAQQRDRVAVRPRHHECQPLRQCLHGNVR